MPSRRRAAKPCRGCWEVLYGTCLRKCAFLFTSAFKGDACLHQPVRVRAGDDGQSLCNHLLSGSTSLLVANIEEAFCLQQPAYRAAEDRARRHLLSTSLRAGWCVDELAQPTTDEDAEEELDRMVHDQGQRVDVTQRVVVEELVEHRQAHDNSLLNRNEEDRDTIRHARPRGGNPSENANDEVDSDVEEELHHDVVPLDAIVGQLHRKQIAKAAKDDNHEHNMVEYAELSLIRHGKILDRLNAAQALSANKGEQDRVRQLQSHRPHIDVHGA
mmetsp:Transcript_95632/g.239615  ORF Transcript_95632/g.239615 Transcript_95632/m.239615 type:complete len:272 (-) Transcript_95632:737-1552(-)